MPIFCPVKHQLVIAKLQNGNVTGGVCRGKVFRETY